MRKGATTCSATVAGYISNIHAHKHLNAFVGVYEEEALNRAKELDKQRQEGNPMGRLHGVVISLKDVISYKDHPLQACSRMLQGYVPIYHATVVEKLLAEEAIIIGHTNCDEFAMGSTNEHSAYGVVRNGLDPEKVPGGSSGGAAVAVQTDCCMVSLGSDTGGSVRQPADFCGVLGLKPTYGRISRYGLIAYASSFDQIGILAKNTEDVALVLEVISGEDEKDSTTSNVKVDSFGKMISEPKGPLRIAYFRQAFENDSLDKEIGSKLTQFIERLRADGHLVEPLDFEMLDYIVPAYYILTTAEASSNLARYDGIRYGFRDVDKNTDLLDFYCQNRSKGFGWEVKKRIMLGAFVLSAGYYDAYFSHAQKIRNKLCIDTQLIFNSFDYILLPTSPTTAFQLGEKNNDPIAMYLADIFTVYSNLTGLPGISIPLFWHNNGLPYGVQVMTRKFEELPLLRLTQYWMDHYREPKKNS